MDDDDGQKILFIIGAVVFVAFISFVIWGKFIYRKTVGIIVVDRLWVWEKAYKYETTIIINKKPSTTTHTRCRATSQGNELPEYAPDMPCNKRSGDKIREHITYYLSYREWESKENKQAKFKQDMWDLLQPNTTHKITLDFFGYVVSIDK